MPQTENYNDLTIFACMHTLHVISDTLAIAANFHKLTLLHSPVGLAALLLDLQTCMAEKYIANKSEENLQRLNFVRALAQCPLH